jgi:aldehyde dehydrogenase family 7 protein A1
LIIHESLYDNIVEKLVKAYASIPIGNSLDPGTLCGPLHSKIQIQTYLEGLEEIKKQGGKILCGGELVDL